jgi:NADH-quinone oxidoreductase subunit L
VDIHIVDGIVDGFAGLTKWSGQHLRYLQTGQTQHYGMVLIVAVLIITLLLGFYDPSLGVYTWGGGN